MKFSTLASTIVGSALLFASKAVADVDFFDWPYPNTQFRAGNCIRFIVDDMPDGDDRVYANLYRENGGFVKTIRRWNDDIADDDEFAFTWCVDRTIRNGRYFVEIFSDDEDDDDVSRSFMFTIANPVATPQTPGIVPGRGVNGAVPGRGVVPGRGIVPGNGVVPGRGAIPNRGAIPGGYPTTLPRPTMRRTQLTNSRLPTTNTRYRTYQEK